MQQLRLLRLRALAQPSSTFYTNPTIPIHLQAQAQLGRLQLQPTTTTTTTTITASPAAAKRSSTTSAPKAAEAASAQSGGSRSQDAAEEAAAAATQESSTPSSAAGIDGLAEGDARGRTGGGEALESTAPHAPGRPRVNNAAVPGGGDGAAALTEDQRREVADHNREFEKRHDRAGAASDDKVDKAFWRGGGGTREAE